MNLLFNSITLFLALSMFFISRENKVVLFVIWVTCLTCFPSPVPLMKNVGILFPMFFFLSEVIQVIFNSKLIPTKSNLILGRPIPLKYLFLWMTLAAIILFLNSPHSNTSFKETILFFEVETICSYYILLIPLIAIKDKATLKKIYTVSFYCLLLLTFWGIVNLVTRQGIFVDFMYKGRDLTGAFALLGSKYEYTQRFRVQSMFLNPFDYGFICIVLLLFNFYCKNQKLTSNLKFTISIACSLFGIITCNTRTILFCTALGVLVFVFFAYNSKEKVRFFIALIVISIITLIAVPDFTATLSKNIASVFDRTSADISGSSFEMREKQMLAVLYHVKDNIMLGNGKGYYNIDLGYGIDGLNTLSDLDLVGLEGIYLSLLLERGIVGCVFYYVFWFSFTWIVFKNRKYDVGLGAFALSLIASYLFFNHAMGRLHSLQPTLIFAGIAYKLIFLSKQNYVSQEIKQKD